MSKLPKKSRDKNCKALGDHQKYISRITKTLYYGKFPKPEGLSLPVTELAAEIFSESQRGRSLDRLHCDDAAKLSRNACVSPCSLVLAILYLEKLKQINPDYVERTASSDLFLVSLMVSCKFLYDDGETDEVFIDEWAMSAGTTAKQLVQLEKDFLKAIRWEVYVNELTFWKKLREIEVILAVKQGKTRGFFTYTELESVLTTIELHSIIQSVVSLSVVLLASYTAAVLTLLGSVFIASHIPGTCIQLKNMEIQPNNYTLLPLQLGPNEMELNVMKTDFDNNIKSEVKLANVLKTSIFLASIEGLLKPFCNKSGDNQTENVNNVQYVSWDWWNVPAMNWVSESAKFMEKLNFFQFDQLFHYGYDFAAYATKNKHYDLEDQIHKATKTRIQDQMESTWHKEWTDMFQDGLYQKYSHYYIPSVKS